MPHTLNVGCRHWAVNLTAWAFVLGGAAAAVLALLQNAVLGSLMPLWKSGPLPTATALLVQNMPWVLGLVGALSLLLMVAGIGLVLRLEWARRVAIGILVVSIVASLAGLWLQHEVVHALVSRAADVAALPAAVRGLFSGFAIAAQALALLLTLGACLLLAWIVRLLRSPSVRQEFA
jgi:hypothetical protein